MKVAQTKKPLKGDPMLHKELQEVTNMKVARCQPYAPAAFTPQERFLVLISVRG
jgi:hypothetical protein